MADDPNDPKQTVDDLHRNEATRLDPEQAAQELPSYTPQARDEDDTAQARDEESREPEGTPSDTPMGQTDNQDS